MRHFYSFLLLAVLSCIASTTAWAYSFVADGIYYDITSSTKLTVAVTYGTTDNNSYSGDVVIPTTVENDGKTYSVTGIGQYAFRNCTSLTSIEIPSSVTSIGVQVFYGCTGLTSIEIPNSVTSIGVQAFYGCTGLTSIEIPSSVTSINRYAFQSCSGLTSVVVSSDNSVYDSRNNCNAIIETASNTLIAGCQNTVIPNSVTSIGQSAFYDCSSLTSIEIPSGVTSIGGSAFESCTGLTSIVIPSSVTGIGNRAFYGCTGLTSIEIPSSVTSIGGYAFYGCTGLTNIEIPSSVTSIGGYAFYGCKGLTSIEIPNKVMSIGAEAFAYCTGLTSIVVSSDNSVYDSRNNCNAIIETASNTLIAVCQNTVIPDGVTSISDRLFRDCAGLTSIEIPSSVTSIGNFAFAYCTGLTSIVIGDGVTSIGQNAFSSCTGLTSIVIGDGVTSIGQNAFAYCSGLTSVEIPSGVTSIGNNAFYNVKAVIYTGSATGSPWGAKKVYTTLPDEYGFYYADEEKTQIEFYAGKGGDVVIPEGVTSLPNSLFSGLKNITSVTIPASVTSIGEYNQEIEGETNVEIIPVSA